MIPLLKEWKSGYLAILTSVVGILQKEIDNIGYCMTNQLLNIAPLFVVCKQDRITDKPTDGRSYS